MTQTTEVRGARHRFTDWFDDAVRPRQQILHHLPSGGARVVLGLAAVNVVLGLAPVGFVILTSMLIGGVPEAVDGGVGSPAWDGLVRLFLLAAGVFLLSQVLSPVQTLLGEILRRRVDATLRDRAMSLMLRPVGLGPLEDLHAREELSEATRTFEREWGTPGQACAGLVALVARYTQLAGFVVVTGVAVTWVAGAAMGFATLLFRYGQRGGLRKYSRTWRDVTALNRECDYLRDVAMTDVAAKETRVYGLTDWLSTRYATVSSAMTDWVSRDRRRVYLTPYLTLTALGLLLAGTALALTAHHAATGRIDLTAVALGMQSVVLGMMLGVYYPEADSPTQFGMQAVTALDNVRSRFDHLEAEHPAATGTGSIPADAPTTALTFHRVTFRYPGTSATVLDGLDLELPAGQSTAVVGVNGAGKTTLVKLLTRLYEPSAGTLTVDGTDISTVDPVVWRRQVGVIFQDFVRFELTAAENIAMGAAHVPADPAAVLRAATRAGIADVLTALPAGMDTPLSRAYPGGVDLSGGQWQRVAIARALYALDAGARVLVLDEPTAALDVRAEAAFFDRFVEMTRGVTSLLISHRFSSVRRADHIVVIDGGAVVERGTHAELMATDGHYARLFTLQAQRFARGLDADGNHSPASRTDVEVTP